MAFIVWIWCFEMGFTCWAHLHLFQHAASKCPSFWQNQRLASSKGQSANLWSVFPQHEQVPVGKSLAMWTLLNNPGPGEGKRLFNASNPMNRIQHHTMDHLFATFAASSISTAVATSLVKVRSPSLCLSSTLSTASLFTEHMKRVHIASSCGSHMDGSHMLPCHDEFAQRYFPGLRSTALQNLKRLQTM